MLSKGSDVRPWGRLVAAALRLCRRDLRGSCGTWCSPRGRMYALGSLDRRSFAGVICVAGAVLGVLQKLGCALRSLGRRSSPPIATHQFSPINCHQPIATNKLPPTNCHPHPPTNCHQPIATNQLSPNCHPPIVTNKLPPTNCHQQTATTHQLFANKLPPTNCHQQTATNQLPPTNRHPPTTNCPLLCLVKLSTFGLSGPISRSIQNM